MENQVALRAHACKMGPLQDDWLWGVAAGVKSHKDRGQTAGVNNPKGWDQCDWKCLPRGVLWSPLVRAVHSAHPRG